MCGQSETGEVAPQAKGNFFSHSLSGLPHAVILSAAKDDRPYLQMSDLYKQVRSAFLCISLLLENRGYRWFLLIQRPRTYGLYLRPDLLRPERHVDGFDAERGQGVQHGVDDGGGRAGGAALAYTLCAQRIEGRWRLDKGGQERWHLLCVGHGVVRERAGEQLAVIVVQCFLVERLADALGQRAVHLRVGQVVVEYVAAVVGCRVLQDVDVARLRIHLDDGDMRAGSVAGVGRAEVTPGG